MPKKFLAITFILLIGITCLLAEPFVAANFIPTEPINALYIRSDGSIDPATPLLAANGRIYTFKGDFTNTTIIVERDGITIDGAGYSISGHSLGYGQAIDISNRTNITIKNLVVHQFGSGVVMQNAHGDTLTANAMSTSSAFLLENADNNYIANNTSTRGYGIYGTGSNNQILSNNFSGVLSAEGGNGMGIYLTGSNNTISRNTIIHGLCMELYCQNSTISYNTVLNGRAGILLVRAANNLVFGNTVRNITTDSPTITPQALYISDTSTNNYIYENNFENNTIAAYLGAQVVDIVWNNVYNNYLFCNNFVNNTQNVWLAPGTPINHWDNGILGNYWSSFLGIDSNHDGISEIPYVMTSNNTDYHPLMAPADISNAASIPIPNYATLSTPTPNNILLPTQPPSPTPSLTSSSTQQPSSSSTPSQSIPEFSWSTILLMLLAIPLVLIIIRKTVSRDIT
jgi:parallel beta-helix repeat protein